MGEELALLMSHRRASSVNSTFTLYMKPVIISRAALDLLMERPCSQGMLHVIQEPRKELSPQEGAMHTCGGISPSSVLLGIPVLPHISGQLHCQRLVCVRWQPSWPHHDQQVVRPNLATEHRIRGQQSCCCVLACTGSAAGCREGCLYLASNKVALYIEFHLSRAATLQSGLAL